MSRHDWVKRSIFPRSSGNFWPLLLAAVCGVASGIGAYTFSYAKGLSYFGTDPKACVNCHIMEPEYAGWQKSSHHAVARCIDCHLPASFIPKYLAKAENGYRHGKLFTTQTFEEPITVKPEGLAILQANCEGCHAALVENMLALSSANEPDANEPDANEPDANEPGAGRVSVGAHPREANAAMQCIHCHWTVGHGERAGVGGPPRGAEVMAEVETH